MAHTAIACPSNKSPKETSINSICSTTRDNSNHVIWQSRKDELKQFSSFFCVVNFYLVFHLSHTPNPSKYSQIAKTNNENEIAIIISGNCYNGEKSREKKSLKNENPWTLKQLTLNWICALGRGVFDMKLQQRQQQYNIHWKLEQVISWTTKAPSTIIIINLVT